MLREAFDAVRDFHRKHGFPDGIPWPAEIREEVRYLIGEAAEGSAEDASRLLEAATRLDDPLALRAHLVIEEPGETCSAMARLDRLETLDGIADSIYVLIGTAVSYGLPLPEAFEEVCLSNMTKEKQPTDPHVGRLRAKGPRYVPPDMAGVLAGRITALRALDVVARRGNVATSSSDLLGTRASPGQIDAVVDRLLNGVVSPERCVEIAAVLRVFYGHERLVPEDMRAGRLGAPEALRALWSSMEEYPKHWQRRPSQGVPLHRGDEGDLEIEIPNAGPESA